MEFDHHLNLVVSLLPTDTPFADAISAAGYSFFPHYCATYGHRQRIFAFAVFHVEHHLQCFIAAGAPLSQTTHFGGVPVLYAGHDTPDRLVQRLQTLCP